MCIEGNHVPKENRLFPTCGFPLSWVWVHNMHMIFRTGIGEKYGYVLEFLISVLEKELFFSIVLELSWKSTPKCPGIVRKMSWNVLESPGI